VRPPWENAELFTARPEQPEYGYVVRGARHGCTREELTARCRAAKPHVDLVWAPDAPRLLPPGEVQWLLDAVLERTRQNLRYNVANGLALLALWSTMAVVYSFAGMPLPLLAVIVFMLGVVPVVQPAAGLWRLRKNPVGYTREQASILRYQMWLGTRRATATGALGACLIAVALVQLYVGTRYAPLGSAMGITVPVAGLVKEKVASGEVWRLLTCELMHGHPMHFAFNFFALLALGRLVEMHGHPVYLPTAFLFSGLCASTFSYYLTPNTSVGASGGIMGLVGFLAVVGIRRRHLVPRGFLKSIALSVALTAATGLVAHQFIDNAAHAGGLVGGLALGAVYVGRRTAGNNRLRLEPSPLAKVAGVLSGAVIVAATVATAWLLLRAAP
jgi:membrane associated rhomboid family serine protease